MSAEVRRDPANVHRCTSPPFFLTRIDRFCAERRVRSSYCRGHRAVLRPLDITPASKEVIFKYLIISVSYTNIADFHRAMSAEVRTRGIPEPSHAHWTGHPDRGRSIARFRRTLFAREILNEF
jgi:hypothetical protein